MTTSDPLTRQTWRNLVALHWAIPGDALRPHLPPRLTPALLEGHCRITLSAFEVGKVEVDSPLPIPNLAPFSQIEIRTYVQDESGTVGVWYLSLGASSLAAATAARAAFGLDYKTVAVSVVSDRAEEPLVRVEARAERPDPISCTVEVRGAAVTAAVAPGSLDELLIAPSRAWIARGNELGTIETVRTPARVSRGTVELLDETWLWSLGIRRPASAALAHVVREENVAIFAPTIIRP